MNKNSELHLCSTKYLLIAIISSKIFLICLSLVLPFGHLVSFLMYFGESSKKFKTWLDETVGIEKREGIPLENHLSDMAKFAIKKLNKHGGFMLEAFVEVYTVYNLYYINFHLVSLRFLAIAIFLYFRNVCLIFMTTRTDCYRSLINFY